MKFLAILPAAAILSTAAVAGPYVNIESNSGRYGNDYTGTLIETHVGHEGQIGETEVGYYVQAGPAFGIPNGSDATTDVSGKAGVVYALTDKVELYKEVYFLSGSETTTNIKAGATYRF